MTVPSGSGPPDDAELLGRCGDMRERAAELDRFADDLERQGNKVRTSSDGAAAANAGFGWALQTVASCASMHEVSQRVVGDVRAQAKNLRTVADGLEDQARGHSSLIANVDADISRLRVFHT